MVVIQQVVEMATGINLFLSWYSASGGDCGSRLHGFGIKDSHGNGIEPYEEAG
jgi:hypothetical protein